MVLDRKTVHEDSSEKWAIEIHTYLNCLWYQMDNSTSNQCPMASGDFDTIPSKNFLLISF